MICVLTVSFKFWPLSSSLMFLLSAVYLCPTCKPSRMGWSILCINRNYIIAHVSQTHTVKQVFLYVASFATIIIMTECSTLKFAFYYKFSRFAKIIVHVLHIHDHLNAAQEY